MHKTTALDPRFKSLPFIGAEERIQTFTSLISQSDSIYTSFRTRVTVKQEPDVRSTTQPALLHLDAADQEASVCTSAEPRVKRHKSQQTQQSVLDFLF